MYIRLKDLLTSEYVFVRVDAHRKPLTPPYVGPFRVIQRRKKNFKVDIGGRTDAISIDRLKPAHLDATVLMQCHPQARSPSKSN